MNKKYARTYGRVKKKLTEQLHKSLPKELERAIRKRVLYPLLGKSPKESKASRFDPSRKMIGIMMIRNENDILKETLQNLVKVYDRIFILDGTEPDEEFLNSKQILEEFDEVKLILRDKDTPGPFPVRDGARQYLLEMVRKRYGVNNWIGILHGDEVYTRDPRQFLRRINPELNPVVRVRVCHFFLHADDADNLEEIKLIPVQERVRHFMWPGTPEDRFFYDDGKCNYDPSRHSVVVPFTEFKYNYKPLDNFIIKQYNFRNPEQMARRASQRIESAWQKNHYEHIARESLFFVDSLHVPGYEPCGWDNKFAEDKSKISKPTSVIERPLHSLESSIIPVFIGGTGRTGSTFLKQMLGMHPRLAALEWESKFISWECGLMDLLHDFQEQKLGRFLENMQNTKECTYPEYLCKEVNNWGYRVLNGSCLDDRVESLNLELSHIAGILSDKQISQQDKMALVNEFIRLHFDPVAVSRNAIGWVEQTPRNIEWACELLGCFENGIFIHILRDPRDVIASLIPLWWGPDSVEEGIVYYKERLDKWKKSFRAIKKKNLEDRLFIIRFEDMVRTCGENLWPVFEKLGLKNAELPIDGDKANIGRWERQFDKQQKEFLNKSLKAELAEQGYC